MKQTVAAITMAVALAVQLRADDLEKRFVTPPDSAKPHTWWHWMNGNITKEGITADLEAMQRAGIGGAQIFNVDLGIPAGPVKFMSPEWREMMKHATKEADRLGLELCIQNCAGWSTSGGPWITPANAMQRVTVSELRISGPKPFSGILPQPPAKLDFYRDIAVFAFRTPESEKADAKLLATKVTASIGNVNGSGLLDDAANTPVVLPQPQAGKPQFVQLEFVRPFTARSVVLAFAPGTGECNGVLQISDDGQNFSNVRDFVFPRRATAPLTLTLGNTPITARFYRALFTGAGAGVNRISVNRFLPSPRLSIEDFEYKSVSGVISVASSATADSADAALVVKHDALVDLTGLLKPGGQLDWNVPAGDWTILRLGHTPTGKNNHPAPPEGTGPEVDKFSKKALDTHWNSMIKPILDAAGPFRKSITSVLVDSYEAENQNWTPEFRAEFKKRRGYDPLPFLPTLTGRVVDNPAVSERFLWDFRRTISDLFAENYFGHFQTLCHRAGLTASIEPYGGPFESLQAGVPADIPMGEFWIGAPLHDSVKLAATVGHIYGRKIIGSESFTAAPGDRGRWQENPYSLKSLGDLVFCKGINRLIFHRYAMQPWLNRRPGMTMGMWGMHFDRTNTWWEQGRAWLKYLARCQYMLQQGRFAADAACFHSESAPSAMQADNPELPTRAINLALPAGYDYDGVNAGVLETAVIKKNQLVLKSGMRYRVLILSPDNRAMTPELLRRLRDLVADGLTLVGPPPEKSPSLTGYPQCDAEIKSLTAEMWGDCDGKTVTEHRLGKGKVVWGQPMEQVFAAQNLKPDFQFATDRGSQLAYIHRLDGDADIYFVSNQRDRFDSVDCTFRVSGKKPELWHPDTGRIEPAPVWREEGGCITVPLQFDPAGSVFVVFRKPAGADHIVSAQYSPANQSVSELTVIKARYGAPGAPDDKCADVTAQVAAQVKDGRLSVTAGNQIAGSDPAPMIVKELVVEYRCGGQQKIARAAENAQLELGGSAEPGYKLTVNAAGQAEFSTRQLGNIEVKTAAGKILKAEVCDVPKPVELFGPWELNFPPDRGAPTSVFLPQLISWTEHADSGVKYFSGTATYIKEVEIPAEMLGAGHSLWLNLGQVKNLAEVSVNGKPLGILWKPPFRVDITAAAKPGKNKLEIKITNLWPNRLIGDEHLPPDRDWADGPLVKWPQWLLDGKPSPTGRLTFTTWHLWKKDDALLPSGLLGPVTLNAIKEIEIKP